MRSGVINHVMAWKKPDGKYVIAVTNRSDEGLNLKLPWIKNVLLMGTDIIKKG